MKRGQKLFLLCEHRYSLFRLSTFGKKLKRSQHDPRNNRINISTSYVSNRGEFSTTSRSYSSAQTLPTKISARDVSNEVGDSFQKYRTKDLSPHLLAKLKLENIGILRKIDSGTLKRTLSQIQEARSRQTINGPEMGPTGTWRYGFMNGVQRIYQRSWEDDHGQQIHQNVLELEPTDEVLSLSLSVDESCVACIVKDVVTGNKQVRLRHIETERETTLDVGDVEIIEWGTLSEGHLHALYFVEKDKHGRTYRVLATNVNAPVLHIDDIRILFQSNDPSEIVDVQRTKGCKYVCIHVRTKTSNEIFLSSRSNDINAVMPRQENVVYHLDVGEQNDAVMLVSNEGDNYRLFEASVSDFPLHSNEVISQIETAGKQQSIITDIDIFRDYLVLYELSPTSGEPQITVQSRNSGKVSHSITTLLGAYGMQMMPSGNICFGSNTLRLTMEDPVTPPSIYEVDLSNLSVMPTSTHDNKLHYKQERIEITSRDGTQVPLTLIYYPWHSPSHLGEDSKTSWSHWFRSILGDDNTSSNSKPVVLTGYGCYGESLDLSYNPSWISLLNEGYVLAFAHTRGGGELGRTWYEQGRKENKPRAIEDFITCAEYLVDRFSRRVTVKGFSAAGVLIGAAVNQRPDLFEKMVLTNAFLDLYETLINPSLYLTAHEWDEFGNPLKDSETDFQLKSYCPVANVASNTDNYPQSLLICTLDDENVPFWNSVIYANKVKNGSPGNQDNMSLFMLEKGGHHLGQHRLQVSALEVAFILQN